MVSIIWASICVACTQSSSNETKAEIAPVKPAKNINNDGPGARDALEKQVQAMFENKKFAELDAMADELRTNKKRFPDGMWKLQTFYYALELPTKAPETEFQKYIKLAEEWR